MTSTWYIVDLLFAQPSDDSTQPVVCESCQVLFEAATAEAAYDKALDWARQHIEDSAFRLVGVRHVHSLDSAPCDGCEVGGRFFEEAGVWQRVAEFVPAKEDIPIIKMEHNPDTPVGELVANETMAMLRKILP